MLDVTKIFLLYRSDNFPMNGIGKNCIIEPIEIIIPVKTSEPVSSNKNG